MALDVNLDGGPGGINPTPEQLDAVIAAHPSGPGCSRLR